jgi:Cytochrome P460
MKIIHRILFAGIAAAIAGAVLAQSNPPPVAYPEGYRNWTHVKSMVINPGHPLYEAFGGIHHLYANKQAMDGYRSGRFPDGAVIVFDLLAVNAEGNAVQETERKVVGVMVKQANQYRTTGGWGFEGFKGDTRERVVGDKAASACYQCHTAQKDKDFVFSQWRK